MQIWVLFLAGGFVAIGVYSYGENVIRTVGENLAQIDYNK
jgi:phosphate/sulfate permease